MAAPFPSRYVANCSLLFTELPLLRRPAAARDAGFSAVEFWWPFDTATPDETEVTAFIDAITDAEVRLVGLNFAAGDMAGGDRGLVSWPGRETEFAASVEVACRIAGATGALAFNALYGNRLDDASDAQQDETALRNLRHAADAVAEFDGTVLVEPVSGAPKYPLRLAQDALVVLDRAQRDNIQLLADLYHLAVNGDDLSEVIDKHTARIGHVQIADSPGRHEPGTGELDIARHLAALERAGYAGSIALEYKPSGRTEDSFGWLDQLRSATREG